ncbi:unnamed protein product [Chironomus riparius]|uniref:Ionotropic receptor n=1 Tax=Chironomus riparius TaxID=315576 RepID=A0A9N9RYQ4_9DIPT|nr:unnamed protein product [Chironomus riparius]
MKISSLIIFLLQIIKSLIANDLDVMSQAISDIIHELYIKNQIHFDILMYGNLTQNSLDLINLIEMKNDENFAEVIRKIQPRLWDHKIYKSAVIFVENVISLNYLILNSKLDSPFPHPIRFLTICEYLDENDSKELMVPVLLTEKIGSIPHFQYFLRNETSSLDLFTIEWNTETRCSKRQLVKLNSFDKKSKNWTKNLVINEKFKNFHGCMLTIRLGANYMKTTIDRFTFEPVGPIVDLFKAMAHVGNFTYNYQLYTISFDYDLSRTVDNIPKNGMLVDHNAHLQMAVFMFSAVGHELHFLTLFNEEKVSCLLTPSEPYDSYEKLIFPFDFWTWIYLLAVFGFIFLSIIIINQFPGSVQNIFYGEIVMTPALNVGLIFFGFSQMQEPYRNFPRIILTAFVLFCLVMRTAYQGVLFEMVAADIRKPLPKTFHDLYINNYSIQAVDISKYAILELLEKTELLNVEILNYEEFEKSIFKNIDDSSAKTAFCNYHNILESCLFHTQTQNEYLDETLYSTLSSYYFLKHNFLYQLADETLQRLLSNGIMMHAIEFNDFCMNLETFQVKEVKPMNQFTLNDLSYGFNLCILATIISYVAFMLELC